MNRSTIGLVCSIALNVILLSFLLRCCTMEHPCPEGTIIKTETKLVPVKEDTVKPVVINKRPTERKRFPASDLQNGSLLVCQPDSPASHGGVSAPTWCTDTVVYADTFYHHNDYKVYAYDTISGNSFVGRALKVFNLRPTVVETITKEIVKPEKVHVYAGAFTGLQFNYTNGHVTNWTIGPQLTITEPHGLAISYGFDAKNNGHLVGVLYKIKLKK